MASHSSSPQTRVLLYGAGSIGGVYLYQLLQAGCHVTTVCRSNYAAVKANGFCLSSARYGEVSYHPTTVIRDVSEFRGDSFDFVLVCTKVFPNSSKPPLSEQLAPILEDRPQTAVVLAQNGIMIEEEIATAFPHNAIISGVVYCPAVQTGPGKIEHCELLNRLELGTYPAEAPEPHKTAVRRFADLMICGGGDAVVHENIQVERWSKLLLNASWNPICALTLTTDGDFLCTSKPYAYDLVWAIMMEIVALAQNIGIVGVTADVAEKKFSIAKKRAEMGTGREMSMLQDIRQGRMLEVEAILGNALRLGKQQGVAMPRLETMYALTKARCWALVRDASQ